MFKSNFSHITVLAVFQLNRYMWAESTGDILLVLAAVTLETYPPLASIALGSLRTSVHADIRMWTSNICLDGRILEVIDFLYSSLVLTLCFRRCISRKGYLVYANPKPSVSLSVTVLLFWCSYHHCFQVLGRCPANFLFISRFIYRGSSYWWRFISPAVIASSSIMIGPSIKADCTFFPISVILFSFLN